MLSLDDGFSYRRIQVDACMTILNLVGGHDFAWFHRNFGGGMQPMAGGTICGMRLAAMCRTLIVNGYDSATIREPY
jgi:hypothetical protein